MCLVRRRRCSVCSRVARCVFRRCLRPAVRVVAFSFSVCVCCGVVCLLLFLCVPFSRVFFTVLCAVAAPLGRRSLFGFRACRFPCLLGIGFHFGSCSVFFRLCFFLFYLVCFWVVLFFFLRERPCLLPPLRPPHPFDPKIVVVPCAVCLSALCLRVRCASSFGLFECCLCVSSCVCGCSVFVALVL